MHWVWEVSLFFVNFKPAKESKIILLNKNYLEVETNAANTPTITESIKTTIVALVHFFCLSKKF